MSEALFPALLGDEAWQQLPEPVQGMHGAVPLLEAKGIADVNGASHLAARWLRRLLGLPRTGTGQSLTVTIKRHGTREVWTRHFNTGRMQSVLDCRAGSPLLYERLGPVKLGFLLHRDGDAIDWRLRSLHAMGVPVPRHLAGRVLSRSGTRDGRYYFHVDVRLPMQGQLIAYDGWLQPCTDES